MELHGRITVYGEAFGSILDHATLSVPTRQSLSTEADLAATRESLGFNDEIDAVLHQLAHSKIIDPFKGEVVSGDLPVGYGLASSTVLGLLCIGQSQTETAYADTMKIDEWLDGFPHTAADFWAIKTQQAGLFGRGVWTPVKYVLPAGSHLLIPEREGMKSKHSATLALRAMHEELTPLIKRMSEMVLRGRPPETELLLQYCRTLLSGNVYSRQQRDVISSLLERGIVAKGTGAIYDRAILVLTGESVWNGNPPLSVLSQ